MIASLGIALALIAAGGSVEQNIKVATDRSASAATRLKAVKALADAKSSTAILPLAQELGRADGELKEAIRRALGVLGATAYFAKQLSSSSAIERLHAAEMLALVPGAEGVEPLIRAAQNDADAKVREHAAAALWRAHDQRAVAPLSKALASDPAPDVRSAAAQSLGRLGMLGGDDAKRALEAANAAEKDPFVRILIREALKRIDERER